MKLPRRKFLHLAAGTAGLPALPRFAFAQVYPARPVHIVVGFQGGTASDVIARFVGEWLSERFGQQFVVENRPMTNLIPPSPTLNSSAPCRSRRARFYKLAHRVRRIHRR